MSITSPFSIIAFNTSKHEQVGKVLFASNHTEAIEEAKKLTRRHMATGDTKNIAVWAFKHYPVGGTIRKDDIYTGYPALADEYLDGSWVKIPPASPEWDLKSILEVIEIAKARLTDIEYLEDVIYDDKLEEAAAALVAWMTATDELMTDCSVEESISC